MFVMPFEGMKRLETIRASLRSDEIAEPAKGPGSQIKIVDFPSNLPFSRKEIESLIRDHSDLVKTLELS